MKRWIKKLNILRVKTLKTVVWIFLALGVTSATVYAVGTLTPFFSPAPTSYTLNDLYNKIVYNIDVAEGKGSFKPSGSSQRSLSEIYHAIELATHDEESPRGQRELANDYLVERNNGLVVDKNTGLMWKRCQENRSGANCTGSSSTHN